MVVDDVPSDSEEEVDGHPALSQGSALDPGTMLSSFGQDVLFLVH